MAVRTTVDNIEGTYFITFTCQHWLPLKNINTIVSNGKRFMAYEIVKRLQEQNNEEILLKLAEAVTKSDKDRGKKHQVFERSFDCKQITSQHFFLQKLSYMHNNPCSGVWRLAESPVDYKHSSAKFYNTGEQGVYLIADQRVCAAVSSRDTARE